MPFVKGQSGNPNGRPSQVRKELRELLDEVFTNAKRKELVQMMVSDALAGDKFNRSLLLAYTFGKPVERQEISGPDGEPLKAYVSVSPDDFDNAPDPPDSAV